MEALTMETINDGIRGMLPREKMSESVRKLRDTYAITPGAPLYRTEFGYYCLDAWKEQGLPEKADLAKLFTYDEPASYGLGNIGWCEAEFDPYFEEKVIEDRGDCEVALDFAGRHVLFFKGRRNGFMPEYLEHPVKDMKTWEENVKWRLNPKSAGRLERIKKRMPDAVKAAKEGKLISQGMVGGYMYLRSLIGPETLLYAFYDMPELIHDCMKTWFGLADAVTTEHQKHVTIEEFFLAEDICYNVGSLISPEMMREFLLPYYRQLIVNIKSRQIDRKRRMFIKIDTDGHAPAVIDVYKEIGMDAMTPFEVASNCDVVEIGRKYPDLVMFGGIDKRVLATTKEKIDKHLEYILPAMRKRGGYVPTCDHGVPEEVSLDNYMHFRKRCVELCG